MRNSRALTLFALIAALSAVLVAPVGAEPSSDELRGDLQSTEQRLQDLQMRAAAVVEDYNEATVALEEASAELAATEREIEELSGDLDELTQAAGDHARLLHKLGPTIELSSVFVAGGEGAEIGARSAALRRIMDVQRADFEGLDAAATSMASLEARLAQQHERAAAHAEEVDERRAEVESSLATYEAEIAELEDEIAAAEDREAREERERREAEEAEARRRAEAEAQAQAEEDAEAEAEAAAQAEPTAQDEAGAQDAPGATTAEEDDDAATGSDTNPGNGTSNGSSGTGSSGGSGGSSGSDTAPPSTRQSASVAVDKALEQVGKPYQYGANGPDSFDCSGLTSFAWRHAGVDITRTSRSQWNATSRVSRGDLQPGDLVFYSRDGTPGGIGHVAMYIGGGDIVEASRSGIPVRTSSSGLSRNDILGYGRP